MRGKGKKEEKKASSLPFRKKGKKVGLSLSHRGKKAPKEVLKEGREKKEKRRRMVSSSR